MPAGVRPSGITDAQANIHLSWTSHSFYAKWEEGQVSLAGSEGEEKKKKNRGVYRHIYIAAAVQRLQEAWHVPVSRGSGQCRNETTYHVDPQLGTQTLPRSTA